MSRAFTLNQTVLDLEVETRSFNVPVIVPQPQPIEVNCIRVFENYTIKPKSTFLITVGADKSNTQGIIYSFT